MNTKSIFSYATADHLEIGFFKYQLARYPKFISTNAALAKIFKLPPRKTFAQSQFNDLIVSGHDREEFFDLLYKTGKVKFFETTFQKGKGKAVWIAISACLVTNGRGEKYIKGIVQDISAYKEKNERLSLEVDVLQGFLDSMPDAIYFKDRKNRITKVNKFYARGFGLKSEEIVGKSDFDFFPEDQAKQMFIDDNSILRTGRPIIGKIERTLLPNGSWNQVITTKVPMFDRHGKIVGTMGITRDMTAHANLEKERFTMILNALAVLGKALGFVLNFSFNFSQKILIFWIRSFRLSPTSSALRGLRLKR